MAAPSSETRRQTPVVVPRHRRVRSGTGSMGIIPITPPMLLHRRFKTQGARNTSRPTGCGVDLMDVAFDAPVDPFSGLIGMPRSIVACGSDESYRIFCAPAILSSTSFGTFPSDDGSPHMSSSQNSSGQSPDKQRISKDDFDPLHEGDSIKEAWFTNQSQSVNHSSTTAYSLETPSSRHYKDDPLLATSRYRHPWIASVQSPKQRPSTAKSVQKSPLTQRTSSGGECMLGKIAQLEVSKMSAVGSDLTVLGLSRNPSSLSLGSGHSSNGIGRHTTSVDNAFLAPTTTTPLTRTTSQEKINAGGDDDKSSTPLLSEEFCHHNKGLKQEIKLIINPLITKGRKLLRRTSDNAALKRSDGCLT